MQLNTGPMLTLSVKPRRRGCEENKVITSMLWLRAGQGERRCVVGSMLAIWNEIKYITISVTPATTSINHIKPPPEWRNDMGLMTTHCKSNTFVLTLRKRMLPGEDCCHTNDLDCKMWESKRCEWEPKEKKGAGVRTTYLFKEFIHKAFLHPHCNFILLLCRLLPLETHARTRTALKSWAEIW